MYMLSTKINYNYREPTFFEQYLFFHDHKYGIDF
jgi:hypothetical protein